MTQCQYNSKIKIPPPTPTSGPVKVLIAMGATALTVLGVTLVLQYSRRQPEDTSRVAQETNPRAPSEMVVGTSWGPRGQGTLMAYI